MKYRREDSFRYEFAEPLDGHFKLVKIEDNDVESSEGQLSILDISPGGMKIETTFELPDPKTINIFLEIDFTLQENELILRGEVVWKTILSNSYEYGIDFTTPENERQQMLTDLKGYVKDRRIDS